MDINFFNPKAEEFYRSLDGKVLWHSKRVFRLLELGGHDVGLPHSRSLGKGLFELRVTSPVHVRFFYTFKNGSAWVLHGFIKKTDTTPDREMEYARMWLKMLLH